ncbi:MAG: hypothetical protein A2Y94_07450 [Caldithrix sp. RBG_13_44_9]|nr:MAG: hypothetical protein A2Y94_07450 [Caldithrix sp. RBG_13_44_9]
MNTKKWVIASLVIFVVDQALSFLFHWVIMSGAYEATASLWRPMEEMNRMMWMMWVSGLVWAFLFVYIFAKGYEGKGIMEGVRFGLLVGVFFSLPMSLGTYASMPITGTIAIGWFIYGVIDITILGILAALLYKPAAAVGAKAA